MRRAYTRRDPVGPGLGRIELALNMAETAVRGASRAVALAMLREMDAALAQPNAPVTALDARRAEGLRLAYLERFEGLDMETA